MADPKALTAADVDALWAGAQLLTAGGGSGEASAMVEWLRAVLTESPAVPLVPAGEAPRAELCAVVGGVGSPILLEEQLPTGEEPAAAVRQLERWTGRRCGAIAAMNAGGVNALVPVIAAAQLGLPLLDVDGMGRVFPLVQQTTYVLAGLEVTPLAAVGSSGEVAVLDCPQHRLEALLRQTVLACGGWVISACYPSSPVEVAGSGIRGGISRVVRAGRLLARDGDSSGAAVAAQMGGSILAHGRVLDIEQHTARWGERSYPAGPSSVLVQDTGPARRVLRLEVHNETVLAFADGGVVAAAPDVIGLLSVPAGQVLNVEQATVGMEVQVLVLPAAKAWRSPRGRALGGPPAFGLPDFVPPGRAGEET